MEGGFEIGAVIYEKVIDEKKYYTYDEPIEAELSEIDFSNCSWEGEAKAYIHTHGAYLSSFKSDQLSSNDINYVSGKKAFMMVVTPKGELISFKSKITENNIPQWKIAELISTNRLDELGDFRSISMFMPNDANHPEIKNQDERTKKIYRIGQMLAIRGNNIILNTMQPKTDKE